MLAEVDFRNVLLTNRQSWDGVSRARELFCKSMGQYRFELSVAGSRRDEQSHTQATHQVHSLKLWNLCYLASNSLTWLIKNIQLIVAYQHALNGAVEQGGLYGCQPYSVAQGVLNGCQPYSWRSPCNKSQSLNSQFCWKSFDQLCKRSIDQRSWPVASSRELKHCYIVQCCWMEPLPNIWNRDANLCNVWRCVLWNISWACNCIFSVVKYIMGISCKQWPS